MSTVTPGPGPRRRSDSSVSATFQTVVTLCLSFLIVAAIRTPFLTDEAIERAKLLERIQALAKRWAEARAKSEKIRELLEVQNVPEGKFIEWLKGLCERMKKAEAGAVDRVTIAAIEAKGCLPDRTGLSDMAKIISDSRKKTRGRPWREARDQAVEAARVHLAGMRRPVERCIGSAVAFASGTSPDMLFEGTRGAIKAKADQFMQDALSRHWEPYASGIVGARSLDWTDLAGDKDNLTSRLPGRQCAAKAYETFAANFEEQRILADALPAELGARKFVDGCVAKRFDDQVERLMVQDKSLAVSVAHCAANVRLELRELWSSDGGEDVFERETRLASDVPNDAGLVGPDTRKAITDAIRKYLPLEVERHKTVVVNEIGVLHWLHVDNEETITVEYDDHRADRRNAKQDRIVLALRRAAGLPEGTASDASLAKALDEALGTRAKSLMAEQLRGVQTSFKKAVVAYATAVRRRVRGDDEDLSGRAAQDALAARTVAVREFWTSHRISYPRREDSAILNAAVGRAVADGVRDRVAILAALVTGPARPKLNALQGLTVWDRHRRAEIIAEATRELRIKAAEVDPQLASNTALGATLREKAGELYTAAMGEVSGQVDAQAARLARALWAKRMPEQFGQADGALSEQVYRELLEGLKASQKE